MSLTAISTQESARRKFLVKSTHIIVRKYETNVFKLRRPK